MLINILAVGDVVGKPGLAFLSKRLRSIKNMYDISFTIVNGENASGVGITPSQADEIFGAGADVITLGNHTWNRREIINYLDDKPDILRPLNYAPQNPGRGSGMFFTREGVPVRVVNLIGRCGMQFGPDNPFWAVDRVLKKEECSITIVDMHAEATSEKLALAYFLDGRVSAVFGTHTHVQTADERIFPKGMGYITDVGMTGPAESVLGIVPEQSVSMFLGDPPGRFTAAEGKCKMDCCIFTVDTASGLCTAVKRLSAAE